MFGLDLLTSGVGAWMSYAVAGEVALFAAGYAMILMLLRAGVLGQHLPDRKGAVDKQKRHFVAKALQAAASAGDHGAVRVTWDREKANGPLPLAALQDVMSSLLVACPDAVAAEMAVNLNLYPWKHKRTAVKALVETLLHAEHQDTAAELEGLVMGGLAPGKAAADGASSECKKKDASPANHSHLHMSKAALPRPSAVAAAKAFFDTNAAEVAAQQIVSKNLQVHPAILRGLFKWATDHSIETAKQVFVTLQGKVPIPIEAYAVLLNQCLVHEDLEFARQLDGPAREEHPTMHYSIYEPLLKIFAKASHPRALELFAELQRGGHFASEGLCGCLLSRCGESRNQLLMEKVVEYCKSRSLMSMAIYKTLMKCYASCGRYDWACDLYDNVLASGIEPDLVMYGCWVKFGVKCGRREFSEEVFSKSKSGAVFGDVQNYMWLIRQAGREGDVARAEKLLEEIAGNHSPSADLAVHNCMLDVYVTNGKVEQAHRFFEERKSGRLNVVTYNTMIKLYCSQGQDAHARRVFEEMAQNGIQADSASYNCLMGGLVETGKFDAVFGLLKEMQAKAITYDNYTVANMMKVAKRAKNKEVAEKALTILDVVNLAKLFEDEVLYNTVLDACIQCRNMRRLDLVLDAFSRCKLKPAVPTFGLMIKANSLLRRIKRCWELWRDMVEARGLEPTGITLSCMLDALTMARQVDDAVALFRAWVGKVTPNIVMYGTLMKGFANMGDADRAMSMYREIKACGVEMNLLAYTTLIDAHGRSGNLKEAEELLQEMVKDGIEPNIITFSAVMKGYCVSGDMEGAFAIFKRMDERGIQADTVLFNTLLDGCVRHSRFQLADHLLDEMEKYTIESSPFTLSILIKLWGKRRDLDKCFELVHKSASEGMMFDVQVVTSLISACFHNQSPERAITVLDELAAWPGCKADAVVYGALLSGLVRCNTLPQALRMAHEAIEASVAIGIYGDVWNKLLLSLRTKGRAEEWFELKAKLTAAGVNFSDCGAERSGRDGRRLPTAFARSQRMPRLSDSQMGTPSCSPASGPVRCAA